MKTLKTAEKKEWKRSLVQACESLIKQRLLAAQEAMKAAQDSANNEDKSSAGDKYETGRAMGQLESNMNAKQVEEARRDLEALRKVNIDESHSRVNYGAVIQCKEQTFFIAIGLGAVPFREEKIIVVSPTAPLALSLRDKRVGDDIVFNGKKIKISGVF